MMNQFMESWQNGSITYDQAMAGIKDLAAQMKDGYSSLEHLDALMGINGVSDLGTLLSQMQNSANASVDQFENYMEVVKANAEALEKYNSSWEEMQQNIKDQITALEKLAEEAAKMAHAINKHSSSGGGGGSNGPDVNDKTFVDSGPGVALAKVLDDEDIYKYHNGGLVGDVPTPDKFIGVISSKNLQKDEVYGKLLKDEWVLTPEDQENIKKNFFNWSPNIAVSKPNFKSMAPIVPKVVPEFNITLENVNLPNVKDPDGFANALSRDFAPLMRQGFSKIFN